MRMDEHLLDPDTLLPKSLPAKEYQKWPVNSLKYWCHYQHLYTIPTVELIDFLKQELSPFAREEVLEIGAGRSNIGECLGIRQTDRYLREEEAARLYYLAMNQYPPQPPQGVEKLEALKAVYKYRPRVVIAAWVSQWLDPKKWKKKNPPPGSIFGVKKDRLIKCVERYIQVSHDGIHGHEQVNNRIAKVVRLDGLVSRKPGKGNGIYIWEGS